MDIMGDRLAPYERRVIELLRNSKDKRARKLAKKRVCWFQLGMYKGRADKLFDAIVGHFWTCEEKG